MTKRFLPLATASYFTLFVAALSPLSAHAQVVDYGALESVFGEPVTTSATGKPQRVSEAPVNMEIITAQDIARYPARTIPEVLKYVTGLDVWENANRNFDVGIRGHNKSMNPRVLVMVNGRQVYLDHYGFTEWSAIPVALKEIRQIEVVKGPNTALFGFNAASGVINIITWNPQFDDRSNVDVNVGTGPEAQASAFKTFKIGENSGLRIGVSQLHSASFDNPGQVGPKQPQVDPHGRDVHVDGRFEIAPHTVLGVNGSHTLSKLNAINTVNYASVIAYEVNSAGLSLERDTQDWGALSFSLYQNDIGVEAGSIIPGLSLNNTVTIAKLQDLFKLGNDHAIRVAGEYRHNVNDVGLNNDASLSYDVYSGSVMWDWAITDHLSWTNAGRIDHLKMDRNGPFRSGNPLTEADYNQSFNAYSANSGLVWRATDMDSFGLSYGRGLEMPSMLDLGGYEATLGPLFITGDPHLNPTVLTTYEINYNHDLPVMHVQDHAVDSKFRVAMYHNHFNDLIDLSTYINTPPLGLLTHNIGSSSAQGIELTFKGTVDEQWRWSLGYNYANVADHLYLQPGGQPVSTSAYEQSNARHIANVSLGKSWDKWDADAYLHYVSARKMPYDRPNGATDVDPYPVPAVYSVGARVAYKITDDVTVSANGTNIQQATSQQTEMPNVDRRLWLNLSWNF